MVRLKDRERDRERYIHGSIDRQTDRRGVYLA